jgi:hypothetical protein
MYRYGGSPPHPFLFHESAIAAFYISIDALNRFQEIDAVGGNPYVVPALGLWFLATESYLSTIYKVAEADHALALQGPSSSPSPKPKTTQKLFEKYTAIEDYFGVVPPRPKKPRAALGEFATLRNTLFHDLTGVKKPSFSHTIFPSNVENVNEVDLMQAAMVSIDVFTYFRYLFPKTDLMPSVQVGFAFDKIDRLASEALFPAFHEIVGAKGLATNLGTKLATNTIAVQAPLPLQILMKTEGPHAPVSTVGSARVAGRLLGAATDARPVADDEFQVPNYVR